MSVQTRRDNITVPFLRDGSVSYVRESQTFLTDGGRAVPLVKYTLVAQIAATKKWVPFTDETAVDGTAIAKGIYMGDDIPAADLVAGDVVDRPVLVGGLVTIDSAQLTIENSKTLNTVVGGAVLEKHRVEDDLNEIGIFVETTVDIDELET
jgi:hypothetical protein